MASGFGFLLGLAAYIPECRKRVDHARQVAAGAVEGHEYGVPRVQEDSMVRRPELNQVTDVKHIKVTQPQAIVNPDAIR